MYLLRTCFKVDCLFKAYPPMGTFRIKKIRVKKEVLFTPQEMPNNAIEHAL